MPSAEPAYDLLIKNVRVVRPHGNAVHEADIAIADGKFAKVAPRHRCRRSRKQVHDGNGRLAFPGVVDAHMHSGIYSPLEEDAVSEMQGRGDGRRDLEPELLPHRPVLPEQGRALREVLPRGARRPPKGRFHVDYGFHLAPMDRTHIDEIPMLIEKHGVASFKIFMFYGSHGLHGASDAQREFLMIGDDERYDFAHFEFIMRGLQAAREQIPGQRRARSRCRCTARPRRS